MQTEGDDGHVDRVVPHVPTNFNELMADVERWPTNDAQSFLQLLQFIHTDASNITRNHGEEDYEQAGTQATRAAETFAQAFAMLSSRYGAVYHAGLYQLLLGVTGMKIRATPVAAEQWEETSEGTASSVLAIARRVNRSLTTLSQRARE